MRGSGPSRRTGAVKADRADAAARAADFERLRASPQQNADTLAKFAIPMSTEPAFQFKA